MEYRHLKLTHEEIILISKALNYSGQKYLELVGELVKIDSDHKNQDVIQRANKCFDLQQSIDNSEKDV